MDYIYAIGNLQQDNFLLIFLMNVLSAKLLSLCNHITDCINASSATKPYTSTHALQWLNMEQQILNGEKQHQGGSFALAATIPNAKPYQKSNHKCGICSQLGHDTCCMNCGSTRHPKDQCWQPGGGWAGEWDTILAEKWATAKALKLKGTSPATKMPGKMSTTSVLKSSCWTAKRLGTGLDWTGWQLDCSCQFPDFLDKRLQLQTSCNRLQLVYSHTT